MKTPTTIKQPKAIYYGYKRVLDLPHSQAIAHTSTALQQEIDIGLLMPRNPIAYEQNGQSIVAAIYPQMICPLLG